MDYVQQSEMSTILHYILHIINLSGWWIWQALDIQLLAQNICCKLVLMRVVPILSKQVPQTFFLLRTSNLENKEVFASDLAVIMAFLLFSYICRYYRMCTYCLPLNKIIAIRWYYGHPKVFSIRRDYNDVFAVTDMTCIIPCKYALDKIMRNHRTQHLQR